MTRGGRALPSRGEKSKSSSSFRRSRLAVFRSCEHPRGRMPVQRLSTGRLDGGLNASDRRSPRNWLRTGIRPSGGRMAVQCLQTGRLDGGLNASDRRSPRNWLRTGIRPSGGRMAVQCLQTGRLDGGLNTSRRSRPSENRQDAGVSRVFRKRRCRCGRGRHSNRWARADGWPAPIRPGAPSGPETDRWPSP